MNNKKRINIKRILKYKRYIFLHYNSPELMKDISMLIDGLDISEIRVIIRTFFDTATDILSGDNSSALSTYKLGNFCFLSNNDDDELLLSSTRLTFYRLVFDEIMYKMSSLYFFYIRLLTGIMNNLEKKFKNNRLNYNDVAFLNIFVRRNVHDNIYLNMIRLLIFESYVENGIYSFFNRRFLWENKLWNMNSIIYETFKFFVMDKYISNINNYINTLNNINNIDERYLL